MTFNCGASPVTITLAQTLKIRNSTQNLVIDGGGLVTLSGGNARRILYIDTCDSSLGSVCGQLPVRTRSTLASPCRTSRWPNGNATNETYVSPGDTR